MTIWIKFLFTLIFFFIFLFKKIFNYYFPLDTNILNDIFI